MRLSSLIPSFIWNKQPLKEIEIQVTNAEEKIDKIRSYSLDPRNFLIKILDWFRGRSVVELKLGNEEKAFYKVDEITRIWKKSKKEILQNFNQGKLDTYIDTIHTDFNKKRLITLLKTSKLVSDEELQLHSAEIDKSFKIFCYSPKLLDEEKIKLLEIKKRNNETLRALINWGTHLSGEKRNDPFVSEKNQKWIMNILSPTPKKKRKPSEKSLKDPIADLERVKLTIPNVNEKSEFDGLIHEIKAALNSLALKTDELLKRLHINEPKEREMTLATLKSISTKLKHEIKEDQLVEDPTIFSYIITHDKKIYIQSYELGEGTYKKVFHAINLFEPEKECVFSVILGDELKENNVPKIEKGEVEEKHDEPVDDDDCVVHGDAAEGPSHFDDELQNPKEDKVKIKDKAIKDTLSEIATITQLHLLGVPNIIPNYNVVCETGDGLNVRKKLILIQPKFECLDIKELKTALKELSMRDILTIAKCLAATLSVLHEKGYVHSDIKPANFLFVKEGNKVIKSLLADFGTTVKNGENVRSGTEAYLPPEAGSYHFDQYQLNKDYKADPFMDSFALGVTLLELVTGRAGFETIEDAADDCEGEDFISFGKCTVAHQGSLHRYLDRLKKKKLESNLSDEDKSIATEILDICRATIRLNVGIHRPSFSIEKYKQDHPEYGDDKKDKVETKDANKKAKKSDDDEEISKEKQQEIDDYMPSYVARDTKMKRSSQGSSAVLEVPRHLQRKQQPKLDSIPESNKEKQGLLAKLFGKKEHKHSAPQIRISRSVTCENILRRLNAIKLKD